MKTTQFSISNLSKPAAKTAVKRQKSADSYPNTTDWGREALRRIEALRKALDGKKLA